jgi:hypothetical protein
VQQAHTCGSWVIQIVIRDNNRYDATADHGQPLTHPKHTMWSRQQTGPPFVVRYSTQAAQLASAAQPTSAAQLTSTARHLEKHRHKSAPAGANAGDISRRSSIPGQELGPRPRLSTDSRADGCHTMSHHVQYSHVTPCAVCPRAPPRSTACRSSSAAQPQGHCLHTRGHLRMQQKRGPPQGQHKGSKRRQQQGRSQEMFGSKRCSHVTANTAARVRPARAVMGYMH